MNEQDLFPQPNDDTTPLHAATWGQTSANATEVSEKPSGARGSPTSNGHGIAPRVSCEEEEKESWNRNQAAEPSLKAVTPAVAGRQPVPTATAIRSDSTLSESSAPFESSLVPTTGDLPTKSLSPVEVRRRFWHILPGLLPFALLSLPHPDPLPWRARFLVLGVALLITGVILRNYRKIARPGERQWLLNVLSYPATVVLMVFLFPQYAEFAAVVVIVLALGDGSATLFGLLFGRRPLPWNPCKTWVGFCSFFLCSAPVAMLALLWEARPAVSWQYAVICGAAAAGLAAIAESLPSKITDNLRSGVAAAVGVVASHAAIVWWA